MSFIVTGRDIPTNCFRCPLDKGVWKPEQDPFILCRYTKEIVKYDDVPTDRRLPCCGLKEMPKKHGPLIDRNELKKAVLKWLQPDSCGREEREYPFETDICVSMMMEIEEQEVVVEAEGEQ